MNRLNNASQEQIVQVLMQWLEEKKFSVSMLRRYRRISNVLGAFMQNEGVSYYTKDVGQRFLIFCKTQKVSVEARKNAALFTERLNCLLADLEPMETPSPKEKYTLPDGLQRLLDAYQEDGMKRGLKKTSIRINLQQARRFLYLLSCNGCTEISRIDVDTVGRAVRAMGSTSYIPRIKTFLRFLVSNGYTQKDYSYIVPNYRIPQPLPSVYSEEEIQEIEETVPINNPLGKRDFAAFLLASRLGLRSGDISSLTFDDLDFKMDSICITQQKTGNPVELPLLPEIREAVIAYVNGERPPSDSPYIFLASRAPYQRMSAKALGKRVARAIKRSHVDSGTRRCGAHALRSSLASSMVNDSIPYGAVKEILGHSDPNSTRHYARLDAEKLRPYALTPPEATGIFQEFLMGRRVLE